MCALVTGVQTGALPICIDFVYLRNRALAGDQAAALEGLAELLKQDLPVAFRMRVYTTATGVAANLEDWPLAFTWLNEGLSYLRAEVRRVGKECVSTSSARCWT